MIDSKQQQNHFCSSLSRSGCCALYYSNRRTRPEKRARQFVEKSLLCIDLSLALFLSLSHSRLLPHYLSLPLSLSTLFIMFFLKLSHTESISLTYTYTPKDTILCCLVSQIHHLSLSLTKVLFFKTHTQHRHSPPLSLYLVPSFSFQFDFCIVQGKTIE